MFIILTNLVTFRILLQLVKLKSYQNLQKDLNKCNLSVFYRHSLFYTIYAFMYFLLPPLDHSNITTVKIAKSKEDISKVLGSVPHNEVRGPRLVSRPWTCRFFYIP